MASVGLKSVAKSFGQTVALDRVDLQINSGEMFFLLGPSGCGKSTLLRIIAGLLDPTDGRVLFDDRDVTAVPTSQRNAVMCFQSYALWPHMTVRENVRFGLDVRKIGRADQDHQIAAVLHLVQLEGQADRKPNQLSGGQQQRVALARALAVRPDCLLLDEPLSNLDAKLRLEMRSEIRRICKTAGLTTIYVTHDQKEALSIADRIAVLNAGKLIQVGTPDELYHRPSTSFVADFIGQTNLIGGEVIEQTDGVVRVATAVGSIHAKAQSSVGSKVILSIRPEQMRMAAGDSANGRNVLSGNTIDTTFLGESSEHTLKVNETIIRFISTPPIFRPPGQMSVSFHPDDVVVLQE